MQPRIAICDDEDAQRACLGSLVRAWAAARDAQIRIEEYASAESLLFAGEDDGVADILLLDIQMGGMDGVQLARRVRAADRDAQIVFITGFADYVAMGYDVEALHYLMKPVAEDKLREVLDRAMQRLGREQETLLVQAQDATVRIPLREILYVEAFSHYVSIRTAGGEVQARANISAMEKDLGAGFVRCHRSYVVGLRHISRIAKDEVQLDGGQSVPLSRRLYAQVNLAFIAYHKRGE